MLIEIDVAHDYSEKFKANLRTRGTKFTCDEVGPAGGNPRFRIVLHSRADLDFVADEFFGKLNPAVAS